MNPADKLQAIIERCEGATDAQISQDLAAAGIDMEPAFQRLHTMIDSHKWKLRVCIGWESECKFWVRWTSADGLYYWLHPERNEWIGEPHQIGMPTYLTRVDAESAILRAPLPPDITKHLEEA